MTDRCNLNCIYCTPLERDRFLSHDEVLSYEEIARVVSVFVKAGVRKLRLTGGEPLIKKDITGLIEMLKKIDALEEITMTTNGVYLKGLAGSLKEAGLDRINISINSLKRERFKKITGFDHLEDVRAGIEESIRAGLGPVKLNVILMKGINDDEALDFVRMSTEQPVITRFIEYFPINKRSLGLQDILVKTDALKERIISRFGAMERISGVTGSGPAQYYKIKGMAGAVGFISGSSTNFCAGCNRLRLDCAGRISPCLFNQPTHDIRPLLRSSHNDEELFHCIKEAFSIKSRYRKHTSAGYHLEMSSIGG